MNSVNKEARIMGFALFAMYFGAGNLIFPAALGNLAGSDWFIGFIGYMLADAGLVILTMRAIMKSDRSYETLLAPVGNVLSKILIIAISLCIGPMIAIPRTAATSYETGFADLMPLPLYSALYFLIAIAVCLNSGRLVNIVGKIMTPVLVAGLLILIAVGIFSPAGPIGVASTDGILGIGVLNGFQTLDGFAAILFSALLLTDIYRKQYDDRETNRIFTGAAIIAFLGLALVYGGLTYLGATSGQLLPNADNGTDILSFLVGRLFSGIGMRLLTIVMFFACMTTTVGLIASISEQMHRYLPRLSYKICVLIIGGAGFLVANVGLNALIAIAAPILLVLYPPVLMLIIHAYAKRIPCDVIGARVAFVIALIVATLLLLVDGLPQWLNGMPVLSYFLVNLPLRIRQHRINRPS
ncbi:MAG: branched-chain amino acid transport system II carrier protein [Eubacteriales bacterium]|nr:branched-chain amino acid transport system II carrier protein [Eubacteriales bacterium]